MLGWNAIFGTAKITPRKLNEAIVALLLFVASGYSMQAQVSVTTWHNDIGRTGQNLNETILNLSNVNSTQFGKLFSQAVDGYVYAQPLYLPAVTIGGQSHNVVYVATENDSVYAFDADTNGGANSSPLWFASMLSTAHGAAAGATTVSSSYVGTDIQPQVGITGTPVIDPTTGTLYVVAATLEGSNFVQRLHALDVTSGAEKFGGPVVITASVPGTGNGSVNGVLTFDSQWENQRPALLLLNGIVYVAFAAHGDNGPWHGWIFSYNAQTLAQTAAFCDSPNGVGSGIWMSGAGLAADVVDPVNHPFGRMFVATGNGDYAVSSPYTTSMDYGDSVLNLDLTNGSPTVKDLFTPYNQQALDGSDNDQGSGGVMLVPTQSSGPNPNLLTQVGKSGTLYLLNQENLGGYNPAGNTVLQEMTDAVGNTGAWSSPAYWNGNVYYWGSNDTLKAFPLTNGQLGAVSGTSQESNNFPGATPSISANGNSQAIVWSVETDAYASQYPAILMAHSATNPSTTLYSSTTNPARDDPGPAVKFAVPTIANGKVYVGTETQLSVYGLLNNQPIAATPAIAPGSGSFNGSVVVTIADATPNSTIYYTLDGTTPTEASPVYTGPITLTVSTTVQALASATGYLLSQVATSSLVNASQANAPVLTPVGTAYPNSVQVTMSDTTPGAAIYYTTNGTLPSAASTLYSSPLTVTSTETINAIAVAPGLTNSIVTSATYTINAGQTGINFPEGFADTTGIIILNGNADLDDSRLQLTNGGTDEASSAWYYQPVNIQAFATEFSFQLSNPSADGMTFTIQGGGTTALGLYGGGLGYQNIPNSVAVKFDLYSNSGEGADSTGLYVNGASPTIPAIDLSNTGINLHSDDTMDIVLNYNGTTLSMTIRDLVTQASYSTSWTINIPATVGGNTAWVGFTGGTGGLTSSQKVLTWEYATSTATPPVVATPTFSPAGGTFSSPPTVTISDTTAGAKIYYTTDGSTPTTASTAYTAPILVGATETLNAIAVETGDTNSSVGTATYTLPTALPAPTFSVAAGTYATVQTVSIGESTSGSTIYYTTNGTTPTTSSTAYSGPITVSATETIEAIAVETGYNNSPVTTATYTIIPAGATTIGYAAGTFTSLNLSLVQNAAISSGSLQLTNGQPQQVSAAWYSTPVPVTTFVNDFTFQQLSATADGMTFTIQNAGPSAIGFGGGGLGYLGIATSAAIKFDLFNNAGEGTDSTGIYTGGASPTVPAIDLTPTGIVLRSGDLMHAHMVYDGTNLTMTLTDTVTNATATEVFPVNIPSLVGGDVAYVGFTGASGGDTATQNVVSWSYAGSTLINTTAPTFSPAPGSFNAPQSVTIADATAGAIIYYTTNGSTPTTSSTKYTGPVAVNASETIQAIAVAPGLAKSAASSATYALVASAPAMTPPAGSYVGMQSVAIASASPGVKIFYTTNGTKATTSSNLYKGPIAVSSSQTINALATLTGWTSSANVAQAYAITQVAATPIYSPAAGTYTATQSVTLSDTTPGAAIYYTTNGTTPSKASTLYSGAINVSATETLQAIAIAPGYTNSAVASATFTINPPAPAPGFSLAAGSYSGTQIVSITDSIAGATIYYTTNGATPTPSSSIYAGPIAVGTSETLSAIAVATGYSSSPVASAAYSITPMVATPAFSIAPGTYNATQSVTLSDATSGATIYYTTNGTTPTTSSFKYSSAIAVNGSETIQAIAVASGYLNSPVASAMYTLVAATPAMSPLAGSYSGSQTVAITSASPGVKIFYTTNGSKATTSSTLYTGPITVASSETIHALAAQTGWTSSPDLAQTYAISATPATPAFSPAGGTYTSAQTVSISTVTSGATIYYTTNGTTPTASSTPYSGPITVGATETLNAVAIVNSVSSAMGSAVYSINLMAATPTFSPAAGKYNAVQSVTIRDASPGAAIFYTTNGKTPTVASSVYSGPIAIAASQTVQAFATLAGSANSAVATAVYTIAPITAASGHPGVTSAGESTPIAKVLPSKPALPIAQAIDVDYVAPKSLPETLSSR